MLVEEFALNTKDQGTVKVTFEENWKKTIKCSLREEWLLSQIFWSHKPEKMRDNGTFYFSIYENWNLKGGGGGVRYKGINNEHV